MALALPASRCLLSAVQPARTTVATVTPSLARRHPLLDSNPAPSPRSFHTSRPANTGARFRAEKIPFQPPVRDEEGRIDRRADSYAVLPDLPEYKRKVVKKWRVVKDDVRKFVSDTRMLYRNDEEIIEPRIKWLTGDGMKYYDPLEKPRNYLLPDTPYPLNPLYKAIAPISNETRNAVFLKYSEDPNKWTPRKLALEYGISYARVEAIIRQKLLEVDMYRKDEVVEHRWSANMDFILGAKTLSTAEKQLYEPQAEVHPRTLTGAQFAMTEEDANITSDDAAARLHIHSFADTVERQLMASDKRNQDYINIQKIREGTLRVATHDELIAAAPKISPPRPEVANKRHEFRIVDLSNTPGSGHYGRRALVREKDGSLREATPLERATQREEREKQPAVQMGKWGPTKFKGDEMWVARDNSVWKRKAGFKRKGARFIPKL